MPHFAFADEAALTVQNDAGVVVVDDAVAISEATETIVNGEAPETKVNGESAEPAMNGETTGGEVAGGEATGGEVASSTPSTIISAAEDFVGPRLLQIAADTGAIGSVNYQVDASNTLILSAASGTSGTLPTWSDKAGAVATLPWLSDTALRGRITGFKVTAGHTISVPAGGTLAGMFAGLNALSSCNLAGLNTANAISMASMFEGCVSLTNVNISTFKTGKCQDMSSMFKGCTNLQTADLTLIATLNVTNMTSMFEGCSNLTTIKADEGFEVIDSEVSRLTGKTKTASTNMFAGCVKLVGGDSTRYSAKATDCDMAQVDNSRYYPGYFTKVINSSASSFAIYSATDNSLRFYKRASAPTAGTSAANWDGYHDVTNIWFGKLGNGTGFEERTTDYDFAVYHDANGFTYSTAPWGSLILSVKDIRVVDFGIQPKTTGKWFALGSEKTHCKIEIARMRALDTSQCTSIAHLFFVESSGAANSPQTRVIDVRGWDTSKVTTVDSIFNHNRTLKMVDLSSWDTSNVTNMNYMFCDNRALITVYVGDKWSTSKASQSIGTFGLKGSDWDTPTYALFGGAGKAVDTNYLDKTYARIDGKDGQPGYFATLSTTGTYAVWREAEKTLSFESILNSQANITGDDAWRISGGAYASAAAVPWKTYASQIEKVVVNLQGFAPTATAYWFSGFTKCNSFDLSRLQTSKITDMSHMFEGATGLQNFDMSSWKTGNVKNMSYMFKGCTGLQTLDLRYIATLNVTNMASMFEGCSNLTTIWADDGFEVITASIASQTGKTKTASANMFAGCVKLAGGDGTRYTSRATDCEMAQVDNARYYPGYFTKVIDSSAVSFAIYSATDNSLRFYKRPGAPSAGTPGASWDGYHDVTNIWFGKTADGTGFEERTINYGWEVYCDPQTGFSYSKAPWGRLMLGVVNIRAVDFGIQPKTMSHWFAMGATTVKHKSEIIHVRAIDTSQCNNMAALFFTESEFCATVSQTRVIDVRGWDVSKVTAMSSIFNHNRSVKVLDLSSWDTSSVVDGDLMFCDMLALTTIYVSELWNASNIQNSARLFGVKGSTWDTPPPKLVGGAGQKIDSNHLDKTYARIDGKDGQPGYLTYAFGTYAVWRDGDKSLSFEEVLNTQANLVGDASWKVAGAYANAAAVPWNAYRAQIEKVAVKQQGFAPTSTAYWFSGFTSCNSFDLAKLNFASVANMTSMFEGTPGLQSLDMSGWNTPAGVNTASAFKGCTGLTSVKMPGTLAAIGANMFEGCNALASAAVPDSVSALGAAAFKGCSALSSVNLPAGITAIPAEAFTGCAALALTELPSGVTSVGVAAFEGCTNLALSGAPAGITTIGNRAFVGCSGISGAWALPALATLGENAFAGCTGLQSVAFGDALASIGEGAFAGATALQSVSFTKWCAPQVTSAANTPNPASTLFTGTPAVIKVPYGTTGTDGFNSQGWEIDRLRLDGVDYYDATANPVDQQANNVGVLEAYKSSANPTLTSGWYVLNAVEGGDITFLNRINISGDVKVILVGNKLITPKGIDVPAGSTLTFYMRHAADTLSGVEAGIVSDGTPAGSGVAPGNAAIGGSAGQGTGTINTGGINITAQGGEGAAGIGAGQGGSIGTINIPGGTVVATGGNGASGIGGAVGASAGTINITGGTVDATGNNAPGVGAPAGNTGTLVVDVIGGGHVIATNNGGDVVVGSADHPGDTSMDIDGVIIAATGAGHEPSRDNIGCDNPVVEKGGVILVVEDPASVEENGNSIKLKEPSVLIVKGYEGGVQVSGNHVDGTTITVTPTGEEEIKLNPGAKMTFTNSAGKEVTITAPDNANGPSSIKLTDKNHIQLAADVTVQVDGKPLVVKPGETLSGGAYGTATDDTRTHNANNPLNVGFNQAVTEMVDPDKGILKTEDSNRYSCGFDVSVWLEILDQVAAADSEKVAASLGESTLGKAVDINLWYKADGRDAVQVTDTGDMPIKVKFNVPAELLEFAKNIKRSFSILRVHDGVVSTLGTFKPEDLVDGLAQFESTKFSTFALAYADEVIPEPAKPEEGTGGTGDNTGNNTGNTTTDTTTDTNLSATPESPNTAGTWQQADSKVQARGSSAGATPGTGDNTPWMPLSPAAPIAAAFAALFLALLAKRTRRN